MRGSRLGNCCCVRRSPQAWRRRPVGGHTPGLSRRTPGRHEISSPPLRMLGPSMSFSCHCLLCVICLFALKPPLRMCWTFSWYLLLRFVCLVIVVFVCVVACVVWLAVYCPFVDCWCGSSGSLQTCWTWIAWCWHESSCTRIRWTLGDAAI